MAERTSYCRISESNRSVVLTTAGQTLHLKLASFHTKDNNSLHEDIFY
jgi:hypothetical protein